MTELEAAQKFKVEINKLDRSNFVDMRIEKVLHYLNKAALFLVKKKYRGPDPGPGRMELMHPVADDLKVLLKETVQDPQDGQFEYPAQYYEFATDHLYYISCLLSTTPTDCTTAQLVEGRYVKPERFFKEMQSPFTNSVPDDPMVTITEDGLLVSLNGFTLGDGTIKYLARPRIITASNSLMELPFEDEIIDVGVGMALEAFESQRVKTQPGMNVANISE